MKKYIYAALCMLALVSMSACREDWTIKDMPPVPEKADGAGYASGFNNEGAALIIPVEVPAAGDYKIIVRGRATENGTPGSGRIACGGSYSNISFSQAAKWSDCEVSLTLAAGLNEIEISGDEGNGLFDVDYIEIL